MQTPEGIRAALAAHRIHRLDPGGLRPAAVLLPLLLRAGEERLLFTLRTDHLPHHRGEISFPGGAWHPGDADLLATALRETEEEIGLHPEDVTVLGRLDDFFSVHDFHVTPYVGLIASPHEFRADPGEIAELIEVPLSALIAPGVFRQEDWTWRGRPHPVDFFRVGRHEIWGLTAAMLRQFLEWTGLFPPPAAAGTGDLAPDIPSG